MQFVRSGPVIENRYIHYNTIQQNLLRLKTSIIVLLSLSYFFLFVLRRIIIYKSKTLVFSLQSNMIFTSCFWKLTKVSTDNLKADIKGTSGRLKMCKNIITVQIRLYQLSINFMPLQVRYLNPLPDDKVLE